MYIQREKRESDKKSADLSKIYSIIIFSVVIIFALGLSRIYNGAHFP